MCPVKAIFLELAVPARQRPGRSMVSSVSGAARGLRGAQACRAAAAATDVARHLHGERPRSCGLEATGSKGPQVRPRRRPPASPSWSRPPCHVSQPRCHDQHCQAAAWNAQHDAAHHHGRGCHSAHDHHGHHGHRRAPRSSSSRIGCDADLNPARKLLELRTKLI